MTGKFFLSSPERRGETITSKLHENPVQAVFGPHQSRNADSRFIAKHPDLNLEPVSEDGRHGSNSCLHEEYVPDRLSGLLKVLPDFKLDRTKLKTPDDQGVEVSKDRVAEVFCWHKNRKGPPSINYVSKRKCSILDGQAAVEIDATFKVLAYDTIAFTCFSFETFYIQNLDRSPTIINQTLGF